nr:hypothetical protein [Hyphomonas sp. Mor2]
MRYSLLALPLVLSACAHAEPPVQPDTDPMMLPIDLSTPEASVRSMMRAMYQGDASMVDQVFLEGAELRRVNGEGEVRPNGLPRWRDWVGTLSPGQAHEELFAVTSEQFGNLATVWAPFVIHVDGVLVGCGVNTLTLARTDGDWRIIFGMDTGEPADTCGDFKARYKAVE